MPMVTSERLLRHTQLVLNNVRTAASTDYDYVESYRSNVRPQYDTSHHYAKIATGRNVMEKIHDRKLYLESIDRTLGDPEDSQAPIVYTQGRTNAFKSIKCRNTGHARHVSTYQSEPGKLFEYSGSFFAQPRTSASVRSPSNGGLMGVLNRTVVTGDYLPVDLNLLRDYGARMHSALNPLRAAVGIGETVVELASGNWPSLVSRLAQSVPDILRALKEAPRRASQDYLNANFGIGPILADLHTLLIKGVALHDSLYGTSFRRWGRSDLVDRHWSGKLTPSVGGIDTKTKVQTVTPAFPGGFRVDVDETLLYDMRFSARFTLARSSGSNNGHYDKALELIRTYGVWTPSLLWDLTPWSWVFDWYWNLGRGINNAFDYAKDSGLKSDYACVTAKLTHQLLYPGVRKRTYNYGSYSQSFESTPGSSTTITKWRIPVNPFGTSVNLSGLTTWQKSILLALGLART